jgi:hypothetical protein
MDTTGDGDERMVQVVTMLAVAGEVLADLVKRFASATTDVMPALEADAIAEIKRMVACCTDTAPLEHIAPEDAAALRAELVILGQTLVAEISGIVELRWVQLGEPVATRTRH